MERKEERVEGEGERGENKKKEQKENEYGMRSETKSETEVGGKDIGGKHGVEGGRGGKQSMEGIFSAHVILPERKIIWAPWRFEYIQKTKESWNKSGQLAGDEKIQKDEHEIKVEGACFLCDAWEGKDDELVVYRGEKAFIIMNKYPYNSGHVMVCPSKHTSEIAGLEDDEKMELIKLLEVSISALRLAIKPHGFNIGINIGKVAGAGLEDHIHVHVVPRWLGDTNFMPVCSNTKVIIEDMKESMTKIKNYMKDVINDMMEK